MIGPAGFAGRSGLRPRRTPRSPWREWLPSSLRWVAEGGTGRSVWLENSTGFDRWCGLQRFGDPGGPGLDPRSTRIAARRVDADVPRESSRRAAGRNRRVRPGVSTRARAKARGRARREEKTSIALPPAEITPAPRGDAGARRGAEDGMCTHLAGTYERSSRV